MKRYEKIKYIKRIKYKKDDFRMAKIKISTYPMKHSIIK